MATALSQKLLAAIVLSSLLSSTILGGQNLNEWRNLKEKIGSSVAVITKTGQRFDSKLTEATDDWLKLEDQGRSQQIFKKDIAEVRIKKRSGGHKAAWIGGLGAAGFAIGAAIGKAANPLDDAGWGSFGPWIGGAIGAAGGAVTGAVISHSRTRPVKEEIVYRAP